MSKTTARLANSRRNASRIELPLRPTKVNVVHSQFSTHCAENSWGRNLMSGTHVWLRQIFIYVGGFMLGGVASALVAADAVSRLNPDPHPTASTDGALGMLMVLWGVPALIVGGLVALPLMYLLQRRSSIAAICFASVGWLFGTSLAAVLLYSFISVSRAVLRV